MRLTRRTFVGTSASLMALGLGPVSAQERRGGQLVIVSGENPRHLNPAVQSGLATAIPGTQIFASPLRVDENWDLHPYLAESWELAEDGLSLTLNLVPNATFHDGMPVTSEDVAFSIMTIKANHPFQTMFGPVEAVETPDATTAIIRLSQTHPALLLALTGALCPILPKHVYDDGQEMPTHPANNAPIGSGPFKLAEYRPGEQITLQRFDDFFIEGRPYLDEIVIRIVRDASSVTLSLESGEADAGMITDSTAISRLSATDGLMVTPRGFEGIGPIQWLAFNTRVAPLDDMRVRQAIAYAMDRDFILNALMRGVAASQKGPIIESSPFFNPDMPGYTLDLDRANALLDEAGHPRGADGTRFTLTMETIPGRDAATGNIPEYLRSQLREVGINVELRASPDFPTWAGRLASGEFMMSMDIVFNWGDPVIGVHRTYLSTNIRPVIWSNTQGYANPEVDSLLEQAGRETNLEARKALYGQFQDIVGEELPVYWINALPYHNVFDDRIGNPPLSIWGMMQAMDEVYWTEDR
ncbi:ABC transporter substrate-binding protein [Pararhodobacter zhoushanensis]|uniref:ABC transporter substrate-binding protein n=1 Tax=Pararhodobacter zhoushanensis TaxID=2479545 RepID=A0ABT3GVN9_9RHOB|nr:ABC transporter substrate-binding protein [Pararhodobacter zhoushanensis]MCW1931587.1 ABC transporter substrate-binding protein [Pararhodobacter zhoushanensis]